MMAERRVSLSELEGADDFVRRHIGPDAAQIEAMLEAVAARSLDDLIDQAAPTTIRTERPLDLPPPLSERDALESLRRTIKV
jgi:glycine dehydrogenase